MIRQLTTEDFIRFSAHRLILVHYDTSYLTELDDAYDCLARIAWIADTNVRSHGEKIFRTKKLTVRGMESLREARADDLILITDDYHEEAYRAVCAALGREKASSAPCPANGNGTADGKDDDTPPIRFFAGKETTYDLAYREHYKDTPLKDMVLFRSGPHASGYVFGMDFADNARALFDHMLAAGYHKTHRLVWLVKDPEDSLFDAYRDIPGVSFIAYDWSVTDESEKRDRYYEALCLSRYIFFTDAYGFARNARADQVRVQLWHGNGYKTRVNFVRCERRYEYTTVISEVYQKIHAEVYGLREDQCLITGLAKQDWLFSPLADWRERLHIPEARHTFFWLPTFRSAADGLADLSEYDLHTQTGLPVVDTPAQMEEIHALLKKDDAVLVIKLHPFQDRRVVSAVTGRLSDRIILLDNDLLAREDIQINQLLGAADAMISDYSSAAVDYLLLDRPMAFTLDDVEAYESGRGFVFDNVRDWMPGIEIRDFAGFCAFLADTAAGKDALSEKRRILRDKMHAYHDAGSCARILERIMPEDAAAH